MTEPASEGIEQPAKNEQVTLVSTSMSIEGPIPPVMLNQYDQLCPGFAQEYLQQYILKEPEHRRAMELAELKFAEQTQKDIQSDRNRQYSIVECGQRFGLTATLLALALSGVAAFSGKEDYAKTLAQFTVVAVGGVFAVASITKIIKANSQESS